MELADSWTSNIGAYSSRLIQVTCPGVCIAPSTKVRLEEVRKPSMHKPTKLGAQRFIILRTESDYNGVCGFRMAKEITKRSMRLWLLDLDFVIRSRS